MKKVMVDIETLGVGNDAVVLSIAALRFDLGFDILAEPRVLFGEPRVWYPSLRQQFALGRGVSEGTLEWWQRDELVQARQNWAYPEIEDKIEAVYQGFAATVETMDEVWAHGVVFDIGILESLFRGINQRPPWKNYGVIRDVRTVVRSFPKLRELGPLSELIAHDPVADCKNQIWNLWEYWADDRTS